MSDHRLCKAMKIAYNEGVEVEAAVPDELTRAAPLRASRVRVTAGGPGGRVGGHAGLHTVQRVNISENGLNGVVDVPRGRSHLGRGKTGEHD